jgi:hypothetical protein
MDGILKMVFSKLVKKSTGVEYMLQIFFWTKNRKIASIG